MASRGSAAKRRGRLGEYEAKRDFSVTTEPPPSAPARRARGAPTFMVHKHDATRLHYDLRLEVDGALASWAVPKGPSYDPADKRLAVQTEDHPLAYGKFEGRIPDDEYGGGDSLIWDEGTYDTVPPGEAAAQRNKGHLLVDLHGKKLSGRWHIVKTQGRQGKKASWLLIKARDEHAAPGFDVVQERPESVVSGRVATRGPERAKVLRGPHPKPEALLERTFPPMLATLVAEAPAPDDAWVYELKYDGFRALGAVSGGRVALWSRNRLDLAGRFPGVARALAALVVGDAVIDGEIVVLDAKGAPRFQLMQQGQNDDAIFAAFDLLRLDGEDLRGRPLEARRDLLVSLLSNAPEGVRVAERLDGPGAEALARAAKQGYEGVVAKQRGSTYEPGRSRAWLKLKAHDVQELAILGFTPSKSARDQVGALLVGLFEGGAYRFAGKVGTGFTTKLRRELRRTLARDADPEGRPEGAPRMRDATWVTPKLACQVRFTEWTADGKLRHPSFQGLRPDKRPEECVRERPAPAPRRAGKKAAGKKAAAGEKAAASEKTAVKLTHPERVMYPRDGITKADVAAYYEAVAEPLLRAIAGRPLAFEHWHEGIDGPKTYRQQIPPHAPDWITVVETPGRTTGRPVRHLVADRPETLRWLAQHAALTLHVWSSRAPALDRPDWMLFDLDPADGEGIGQAVSVALKLRRLLDELGLPSLPKTSGKRGLHVLVPLAPEHTHDEVVAFATRLGEAMASALPEATVERAKAARNGRLYLDCLQNGYGKLMVAPYALRGVDGATVSAPLAWSEVTARLDPSRYNLRTMPARLDKKGDLFAEGLAQRVKLPALR